MKTAVSIPDDVYQSIEVLTKQLGVSRSRLYTHALKNYLKELRSENITRQYDEYYKDADSSMDPTLLAAHYHSIPKEDW
jgi:metal-responsive CopG/Arc/MetJ family transcriptional regulator